MALYVRWSIRWTGICSLCLLLSACGFALRGSGVLSSKYDRIQLNLTQPNGEFSRLLRRSLEVAAVETVVSPANAQATEAALPVLQVGAEQVASRPVTVNPRARAAQYELRVSIDIAMAQQQRVLIDPETLFVERVYFEDIENISGNQEEVEIITAEMRRELVNQLMRRLEASGS